MMLAKYMPSSSRGVSLISMSTPYGVQTRRIETSNGRILSDEVSVSPGRSSTSMSPGRSLNHSSAGSFFTPSLTSSAGSFSTPSLMSSAISNNYGLSSFLAPLFPNCGASRASPYSHMPMSRVFRKPTNAMKSGAQVQAAISQLSSSASPTSIKRAKSHLNKALALKKPTSQKKKTTRNSRT